MMKITLQVSGQEMTFSEEELVAILEMHFYAKGVQKEEKVAKATEAPKQAETKVAQSPTEEKWFEVNPMSIDQRLFLEKRDDPQQERTRLIILKAFAEVKNNSKYARSFKTLMPENWVEQALEWAQRIANGETWKAVCNDPDTANWYRLIEWKNGYVRLVGGLREDDDELVVSYK